MRFARTPLARRSSALFLAGALALGGAACGDDGDTDTTDTVESEVDDAGSEVESEMEEGASEVESEMSEEGSEMESEMDSETETE
jgi:hypothetical protein